jgi:hypothetical protein
MYLMAFPLRTLCAYALLLVSSVPVEAQTNGQGAAVSSAAPVPQPRSSALIYDSDYPYIDYAGTPVHNDIARLQARIARGEVKLEYRAPRGYLESILKALGIDPSSQSLVFSKTSLQVDAISRETPRAIYFNDDTYVAWVQGTGNLEMVTMDSDRGPVFYTLAGEGAKPQWERETLRCLACHDSSSEKGGGVPQFLFLSSYTLQNEQVIFDGVANMTTDATPMVERWGGWYVTGNDGGMLHLGNIPVSDKRKPVKLDRAYRGSVASLSTLFDTTPYLSDKSDIVALLVLEHQVDVHNLIIHANYKSRMFLERQAPGASRANLHWQQLTPGTQKWMKSLLEPLVKGMLLVDAARLPKSIASTSGFSAFFQSRGPRDAQGRSLRDLDLNTRLFRYPMSFLVYSEGFDFLPPSAKEYVYSRFADILQGRDQGPEYARLSASDRRAVLEILQQTKPDFARALKRGLNATDAVTPSDAVARLSEGETQPRSER